jgi:hypothetical protein
VEGKKEMTLFPVVSAFVLEEITQKKENVASRNHMKGTRFYLILKSMTCVIWLSGF